MYSLAASTSVFQSRPPTPPPEYFQPLPLKGEDNGATCEICGVSLRRNTDLPRHMLTHNKDKESLMFRCPVDGCGHQTLQKSNLATHIRTHTRAKPHKCPEHYPNGLKCDFSTADPSSLHRHRKRKHGYAPRPKPVPPLPLPPRAASTSREIYRAYVPPRRDVDVEMEGDAEGDDVDAEGEPDAASECESEESFGGRAKVAAPVSTPTSTPTPAATDGARGGAGSSCGGDIGSNTGTRDGQGDGQGNSRTAQAEADDDDDADVDGEGEPENETEPVLGSHAMHLSFSFSSERTEPPPPPHAPPLQTLPSLPSLDLPLHPYPPLRAPSGHASDPAAPVFANISDTRTYVDAR